MRYGLALRLLVLLFACVVALAPSPLRAATNNLTADLQRGLFEEEANRNLDAAISAYQSLVGAFDKDRQVAATAVFRLGECYRKLGRTNEAVAQYERVVQQFPDQQTLVTLSRQNLTGLGATPSSGSPASLSPAAPTLSRSARAEQARLIEQQIKIVEAERKETQAKYNSGVASMSDVRDRELQILKLRQQLAALDGDPDIVISPPTSQASSPEAQELERTEQMLARLQGWDFSQIRKLLPTVVPDADFERLEAQLSIVESAYSMHTVESEQKKELQRQKDESYNRARDRSETIIQQLTKRRDTLAEIVAKRTPSAASAAAATTARPAASAQSLITDAEQQEIRRIQVMIQNSPDLINAPGSGGATPLHLAAQAGQLTVARFLLDHGASVDARNNENETPLTLAATAGHKAMVELLLSRGADVNVHGRNGYTPLHQAAQFGYNGLAEVLLTNKADVNVRSQEKPGDFCHPLDLAARKGHSAMVELLLRNGAKPNDTDANGLTPIMWAANGGHVLSIKALLAAKADPNIEDQKGRTALSYAVGNAHTECIRALLEGKADPNVGRVDPPLIKAVWNKHQEIAEILLRAGADPNKSAESYTSLNQRDTSFVTYQSSSGPYLPIQIASRQGDLGMARLLFKFKANPAVGVPIAWSHSSDPLAYRAYGYGGGADMLKAFLDAGLNPDTISKEDNCSLIARAAERLDTNAVAALLAKGASPNALSDRQQIPLMCALNNANSSTAQEPLRTNVIRMLLDAKVDVNAKYPSGLTPLINAVRYENPIVASMLLSRGANPNLADDNYSTPLHQAVVNGKPEMVQLLLSFKADPNIRDKNGKTPLAIAKENSSKKPGVASGGLVLQGQPNIPPPGQPLAYQWHAGSPGTLTANSSTPPGVTNAEPPSIVDLLRQHGGKDDLPNLDRIEVRRVSSNFRDVVFRRQGFNGIEGIGKFTLFELLAVEYKLLSTSSTGDPRSTANPYGRSPRGVQNLFGDANLQFPDFTCILIRRPTTNGLGWTELKINAATALDTGDCSGDVSLEWGDIVEIRETDHPIDIPWNGLSKNELTTLKKCLTRTVEIRIKGTATKVTLGPDVSDSGFGTNLAQVRFNAPVMIRPVLFESKLLQISSDLGNVQVRRSIPGQKEPARFTVNCEDPRNAPDLWLRDGDVIEVPEKAQ